VVANATRASWQQGQDALRDVVGRVTALLRSIENPSAPAVGQWNLGEVAVHLTHAWMMLTGLGRRDLSPVHAVAPNVADVAGGSVVRSIWDLADVNTLALKNDPERTLSLLADRIEAQAEQYFGECVDANQDEPRPWMIEGTTVPQSMLTYNLLNETLIHGYDIAHAAGRQWRIEPSHASMVLSRFLVPALQVSGPRVYVVEAKAGRLRATFDLRIRGGESYYFLFEDGNLTVEEPSSRKVDCHISADPVALLLVAWDRRSQWPAIAQGKLMAWGVKPWLGIQFKSFLRTP
jgi:SCP-2 sterol transfer family